MHIPSWMLWVLAVLVVLVFMPGLRTALVRFVWFSARAIVLLVGVPFLAFLLVRLVFAHAGFAWAAVTATALLIVVLPGMYGALLGTWLFRPRGAAPAIVVENPSEPATYVQNIYNVNVLHIEPESSPRPHATVKNVTEPKRLGSAQGGRRVD